MMKTSLFIISFCAFWALTACSDFLKPRSQSEFIPETVESLQELLIGEVYMGPDRPGMFPALGLFDDDVACAPEIKYDASGEEDVEKSRLAFTWDPEMIRQLPGYGSMYSSLYKCILGCNAVLDFMDEVSGNAEKKAWVKAQALTMRAFYYLHLVNLFGKPYSYDKTSLGVPLKLDADLNTTGIPRSSVEKVYQQIVADLSEATELFVQGKEYVTTEGASLRATPQVAQLLLSRTYLYMEEWEKAATWGEKVMSNWKTGFYDLATVQDPVQAEGTYPELCDPQNPEVIFLYGARADAAQMGFLKMSWTEEYEEGKQRRYQASVCRASDELVACFDETPGDLRKNIYLIWDRPYQGDKLLYYRPLSKYGVTYDYNLDVGYTHWGAALKISEAYLNVAEAAAMIFRDGGEASYRTKALECLNHLRTYRFAKDQFVELTGADFADGQALVDFVRRERRRELCFEHHRWFDLRRYGMEPLTHIWRAADGQEFEYQLQKNDPGYTLLIPEGAFSLNPALVQNEKHEN